MLAKKCFFVGIFTSFSLNLAIAAPPAVHPTTGEPLVIDCLNGTPDAIDMALPISITYAMNTFSANDALGQDELKYRLRGDALNLRHEGIIKEPVSTHFTLISATLGRTKWGPKKNPSKLNIRFYSPTETEANLRVREINSLRSYRLDAARNNWKKGWNHFGPWPTSDVIDHLEIDVNNLGITVTKSKSPSDSGQLFPAILFETNIPPKLESYTFVVKSNTGLAPLSWSLYRILEANKIRKIESKSGHIEKLAAGSPIQIRVGAKELVGGYYKLRIRGELVSRDRREIVRKSYVFYHKPNP